MTSIEMLAVSPYTDRILAAVQRKDCADPLYQILQDYARAVAEHNVSERDAQIAQLEKANEQLHAHGERMHEQLQKMRAAQQPPAEAVGTVLGGEFHYLRVNHGLPDGTKLYTPPPSAPVGVAADILRIVDTAIDVCNDRDRPAMAEDLEAVRLYVEQASAALAHQPATVTQLERSAVSNASAPVGVAEAWQQGYHQGVQDERTSEANIGIAGFGAKVEPARNNPYLAQRPEAVDEAMVERATMALLGKSHDTAPGIDWRCDRAWTVNKVRKHMRTALTAALADQQPAAVGDTRRLEYLIDNELLVHRLSDTGLWMVTTGDLTPAIDGSEYDTWREAIDDALAAQKGGAK